MSGKTRTALLIGLFALAAGCHPAITAAYWIPEFSSEQSTGGAPALDLDSDLGVAMDDSVMVVELSGDEGRQRLRIDSWKISGQGIREANVAKADIEFAGNTYPLDGELKTTVDMEILGILWEPALFKSKSFRLRLAVGANLLAFNMKIEETSGPQWSEVLVPGTDGPLASLGLDYIPVPLVGVGIESELGGGLTLVARAEMFDAEALAMSEDFSGTFLNAVAGILYGKGKGVWGFAGFRHFHAEYSFENDSADSSLSGPIFSLSLRF